MVSSAGFCYSDVSPNNNNIPSSTTAPNHIQPQFTNNHQIQEFHHHSNPAEIFNLTTGMEMIGFSKTSNNQSFSTISKAAAGPSSSKTMDESTNTNHHDQNQDHDHHHHQFYDHFTTGISETSCENLMVGPDHDHQQQPWQENRFLVDDSSLRCVFPCEGNERPSQGLSLSLSSANPSSIGLQSFELRQTNHHHQQHQDHHDDDHMRFLSTSSRDGYFGKVANMQTTQQMNMNHNQDGFLGGNKAVNFHHQVQFQLKNSKYLNPTRELLNEFCSLGTKQTDLITKQKSQKLSKQTSWDDQTADNNGASSSKNKSLYSLEFMELQKRKTKLLSMLEEVERRYKHYCDQMKAVVSSFEAVAGAGAATVYSALASKAMSRHFRCLKDGIVNQIQATRKAMGEKDATGGAPGTTRGETPRLRLLDQTLRQQRAFQQMTMMESHPWRPQRGLPERSVSVLRAWLFEHFLHPYPSDVDKVILARQTGLSRSQVSNWFINARVRLWKPMVEEMYLEETKERELANMGASSSSPDHDQLDNILGDPIRLSGRSNPPDTEQKPTHDQLLRIDSECLSSIVINPEKSPHHGHNNMIHQIRHQNFGGGSRFGEVVSFGSSSSQQELDFSSYNNNNNNQQQQRNGGGSVLYSNHDHQNPSNVAGFNNGGGVSLTLGLQQHAGGGGGGGHGGGVSLAFSHPGSQSSVFYSSRDHNIDDDQCQQGVVQYSLLDGEGQNLPYRNLMGAQLLHDLA
ncbi:homeobox protein BEL1 homolog [Cannabis sativa]|uniref:homeobox protein BEL1 homolog n=1 Tax=Cannabis sativa TaxID=3483 RepID=UPI0011DF7ADD|nr:homeobox protein BEL1 homolog [Cannabis sativa]XP_030501717.1 homeobox protein BEL1 homolog [Cannabis sativa]XP_030501718.1 homeobox protein BEL1 homolog [Cannabis sativa]XP_030501719.1 homeobox protein BEL1 homolog [Cannabis sativa]XP_060971715.1 homeobox protein BEL1 homolog [Cannabis sativa]XP_060971716.1 homeobox protein BEL1 homolog [Cannabis sativa]